MVNSSVGAGSTIRSCVLNNAKIGKKAKAIAGAIGQSDLADLSHITTFADVRNVKAGFGSILGEQVHSADIQSHLMSMHMAGSCEHFKVIPTGVKLQGMTVLVPAVPMIGGGAVKTYRRCRIAAVYDVPWRRPFQAQNRRRAGRYGEHHIDAFRQLGLPGDRL